MGSGVVLFGNWPRGYMDDQRNNFHKDPISGALYSSELMFCFFAWIVPGGRGLLVPACSTISNPNQVVLFLFPSRWHSHRVALRDNRRSAAELGGYTWWYSDPSHCHMCHSCFRTAPDCHQPGGRRWEPDWLLKNTMDRFPPLSESRAFLWNPL